MVRTLSCCIVLAPVDLAISWSQDLKSLAEKFKTIAASEGNPNTIVFGQLPMALAEVGIVEKDTKLLEKVFSLMDASGDGQVFFKDFIVCCSSMISKDLKENLRFRYT